MASPKTQYHIYGIILTSRWFKMLYSVYYVILNIANTTDRLP